MKNPNGYGTVIKLPGKRRRPYAARITSGYTPDGKQQYKYIGYFETQKRALNFLAEWNAEHPAVNRVNIPLAKIPTFSECLNQMIQHRNISEKTEQLYISVNKRLAPYLGGVPVDRISRAYLQQVLDTYPCKKSTAGYIRSAIKSTMEYAVRQQYILKNPAVNLDISSKETSTPLHRPFTDKEIHALEGSPGDPVADFFFILCLTGLRPGELLDIKKEGVHLESNTPYLIGGSKTKAGKNRIIPLHRALIPVIKKYNDCNSEYLFSINGKHPSYNSMMYYKKNSKWKNHTFHDGRHTCATLLNRAGAPLYETQAILGHAHGNITGDVYTHPDINRLYDVINLVYY